MTNADYERLTEKLEEFGTLSGRIRRIDGIILAIDERLNMAAETNVIIAINDSYNGASLELSKQQLEALKGILESNRDDVRKRLEEL